MIRIRQLKKRVFWVLITAHLLNGLTRQEGLNRIWESVRRVILSARSLKSKTVYWPIVVKGFTCQTRLFGIMYHVNAARHAGHFAAMSGFGLLQLYREK